MKRLIGLSISILMAVSLTACGGSSSTPVAQTPATNGFTGVAVDPYIVGAVFIEVDGNGNTVQQSTPSSTAGVFTFANNLTTENIIAMLTKGLHNGVPFTGNIKRKVTSAEDAYVVSPITTLMAEGQTADQVVSMLKAAGFTNVTPANLTQDPVAAVATDPKAVMLLANLAVNTALNATGGDAASPDILTHVTDVKRVLDHDTDGDGTSDLLEAAGSNIAVLIKTAATVTNYVNTEIEKNITAGTSTAVQVLTPQQIQEVANAPVDAPVEIVVNETTGGIQIAQATIAENLATARAAWAQIETCDNATGVCDTNSNKLLETAASFIKARALVGIDTNATTEDADRALFFGSLAELVKLADPYSKATNSLNTFGDMLSAFGFPLAPTQTSFGDIQIETCDTIVDFTDPYTGNQYTHQECSLNTIAATSPDSTKVLTALRTNLVIRLKDVIEGMSSVSTGFSYDFSSPSDTFSVITNIDQTDALFLKAIAEAMIAQLDMIGAYKTDVNLVEEQKIGSGPASGQGTPQDFLDRNPNLFALSADSQALLTEAKTYYTNAANSLTAAVNSYVLERNGVYTDPQYNEFISLDAEICGWNQNYFQACAYDATKTQDEVANIQAAITKFKNGLNNRIIIDTPTGVTADLSQIFNGIDLRSKLPTVSTGAIGDTTGLFPDPTIGGILIQNEMDINEDLDGDGSPDLIDGYSYFFPAYLNGKTFEMYYNTAEGYGYRTLTFTANNNVDFTVNFNSFTGAAPTSDIGTGIYTLVDNGMSITWDQPLGGLYSSTETTLIEKINPNGCGFNVSTSHKDAAGAVLVTNSYEWWSNQGCY